MDHHLAPRRVLLVLTAAWFAPLYAQGPTWASPNAGPAARYDHAMAFDEGRGRAVLFGGRDAAGTPFGDTWEWDGAAWVLRMPAHSPSARTGCAMAYDRMRGVTVLFGGNAGGPDLADTWEWNGADWTQRLPATIPSARSGAAMAYHGGTQPGVLMHGGFGNLSTWQWNGTNWTLRQANGPASAGCGMAYLNSQQRTVLLGNPTGSSSPISSFAWDGSTWSTVPGSAPGNTRLVYDPDRNVLLTVGGQAFNGLFVGPTIYTQIGIPIGSTGILWSNGPQFPGGLSSLQGGSACVYDTARRSALTFGGLLSGFSSGPSNTLSEMPSATSAWSTRFPSLTTSPTPRTRAAMEFDDASGRVVLFGGYDGSQLRNDAWSFDGRDWTNHGNSLLPPRIQASLCSNPAWGGMVLFGGGNFGGTYFNDTMVWTGTEFLPTIMNGPPPPARADHDMVYRRSTNTLVMYGGYNGSYLSDTWELRSTTLGLQWVHLFTVGSPGPRNGHRLAYDERRDRVVMFGGSNQGIFDGTTWELSVGIGGTSFNVWNQVNPPQSPPPRWSHDMEYDPARGVVVLTGGYGNPLCGNYCATWLNDVWEYDGITWTQRVPASATPPPREAGSSCYDRLRQRIVLQCGSAGGTPMNDTWFYNAPVDRFGTGMVGGTSVSLRCLAFPVAGQMTRFELQTPIGIGWITVYAGPAPAPGITLGPGLLCSTGSFYGVPAVVADAMGSPGLLQFPLPLSLAGQGFVVQGVALDPALCLRLSDPLAATIQLP